MLVDKHTVVQLPIDFPVDFFYEFAGGLYGFFVAFRGSRSDRFMVGHTDFVKFFEIGRVDGNEINALVEREMLVQSLHQYAVVE